MTSFSSFHLFVQATRALAPLSEEAESELPPEERKNSKVGPLKRTKKGRSAGKATTMAGKLKKGIGG